MTGTVGRSQAGLDRLLLFVVVVLGLVFLVPHALGLAGIDVGTGEQALASPSDHDLTVLAARGEAIAGDGSSIGVVHLTVVANGDRAPVDLRDGSAIWVDDQVYFLAHSDSDETDVDGFYAAGDAETGAPVLETPKDHGTVRFDLGTDDVEGVDEFGERLEPGETATVTLVTDGGETLTRTLSVPDPIPQDQDEVWL